MEPVVQAAHADLNFYHLFLQADIIVKTVMIGLALASIWCWAVIIERAFTYASARRQIKALERALNSGRGLDEIYTEFKQKPGIAGVLNAAMQEWFDSHDTKALAADGLRARISIALDLAVAEQSAGLRHRLGLLATVSSAAPFVGLFGTVWGIMNAFTSIAASEDTSLAVVAPGIAEALFATALGLLAAIPAVIAYNKLSGDASSIIGRIENFADRLTALLSRARDAEAA